MGRRGGSGSGGGGGYSKTRRHSSTSTLSASVVNSRVTACRISHLSSDDIAEHLYSAYPDYKHYKLIPFRNRIKQILVDSSSPYHPPSSRQQLHEDDHGHDDDEDEESIDMVSPHRKRHRRVVGEVDRQERLLLERENAYLRKRRDSRTTTAEDEEEEEEEESVSTSEDAIYGEDIEPKFDLMKNMLRDRYGGSGSVRVKHRGNNKGKEEDNLEVEDVRREKEIANKNSGGSEVVEDREQQALTKSKEDQAGAGGVRFKDLGGMKHVLDQLRMEVIVPLYHPQLSLWLGVKPMAGILLHGPPGCGKTKLAHAIANETGVPFYQISATEIVSGVSGISSAVIIC